MWLLSSVKIKSSNWKPPKAKSVAEEVWFQNWIMLSVLIQIQIHPALIQMFQFQEKIQLKDERDAWSPDQTDIKKVYQVGFVILNKFRYFFFQFWNLIAYNTLTIFGWFHAFTGNGNAENWLNHGTICVKTSNE